MANESTVDQQQLQSTIDELYRKLSELFPAHRDALRNALNTIQVGENQRLGLLAAADDLASASIGRPEDFRNSLINAGVLGLLSTLDNISADMVDDPDSWIESLGIDIKTAPITINVGEGGDYPTLQQAIWASYKIKSRVTNKTGAVVINLMPGYIMTEQIWLAFYDLSHITITSDDAVVYCDTTNMSEKVKSGYTYTAMFCIVERCKAPVINVQFEAMQDRSEVIAFFVTQNSSISFFKGEKESVGARRFKCGVHADYQGSVIVRNEAGDLIRINQGGLLADFSYSWSRAVQCYFSGRASIPCTLLSHSGTGLYLIYNSSADCLFSDASDCDVGFSSRDLSRLMCRSTYAERCKNYGYYAVHNANISGRSHSTDVNDSDDSSANGSRVGLHLGFGCTAEISGHSLKNCTLYALRLYGACNLAAREVNMDGSANGVIIDGVAELDAENITGKNIAGIAVQIKGAGTGNFRGADFSGSAYCFDLSGAATLNAENCTAVNLTKRLILSKGSSNSCLLQGKFSTDKNGAGEAYFIESGNCSNVDLSGADIRNQKGVVGSEMGRLNMTGAFFRGSIIYSTQGAQLGCRNLVWESIVGDEANNVVVTNGGTIIANGMTSNVGELRYSKQLNTLGGDGIIYG